jgi:hypothetical protein
LPTAKYLDTINPVIQGDENPGSLKRLLGFRRETKLDIPIKILEMKGRKR